MSPRCGGALVLVLVLVLGGCGGNEAESTWEYVDDDTGFSIRFPDTWEVSTDVRSLQVVGASPVESDGLANRVGVLVEDLPGDGNLTLEEYVDVSVTAAPQFLQDFDLESRSPRALGGEEGVELTYTGRVREYRRCFLAVVVVAQGRAYTVTYTADESNYEDGLDAANGVIDSFALT